MHCGAVRADARTLQLPQWCPCSRDASRGRADALVVPRRPTFLSLPSRALTRAAHAYARGHTRRVIAVIDFPPTFGFSAAPRRENPTPTHRLASRLPKRHSAASRRVLGGSPGLMNRPSFPLACFRVS